MPTTTRTARSAEPVMHVTGYDRAAALVLAAVVSLVLAVGLLWLVWSGQHQWRGPEPVPLELVVIGGGKPDGAENESLDLKTPFDERPDPSLAELEAETEVEPMLDSVVDLADKATDMARHQPQDAMLNAGKPGSRSGTGAAGLGMGPGDSGLPREQSWFIAYGEGGSLASYARTLDFFGIELAALQPGGRVVYLSNLAAAQPNVRNAEPGAEENRLYMTWQGGGRRKADLDLFKKAGVEIGSSNIYHFFSPPTEEQLARLELAYANRAVKDIRRTYFSITPDGTGYQFFVTRQAYFR